MRGSRAAILVGVLSVVFTTLVVVRVVSGADWDLTVLVAFGEEDTATRTYAEERLGDPHLRPGPGHDGRFFFVQSNDPWVFQPAENAQILDRPLYRSQRMFYPVLAGGAGFFGPQTVVAAMLVVNLLAMGLGAWVVGQIAMEMGGSPWWGLAFTLNLGLISELDIGGAGVVAAVAAFAAVLMFMRDRLWWGIAFLALAALAREAMLIAAAGSAIWLWRQQRRRPALLSAVIPGVAVLSWAAYLRLRIGGGFGTPQIEEIGWPFVGIARAIESWVRDPLGLVVGAAMMLLFVLFVRRVFASSHLVGWASLGFVGLAIVFTEQVWRSYFDITRAVAPIITSFVLLVFLGSSSTDLGDRGSSEGVVKRRYVSTD